MKRFVLDCSVAAAWCFADEKNSYVDTVLESFCEGYEALVPPLWVLEVVNVLALAERRKRLLPAETEHFFELYSTLPIFLDQAMTSVAEHREPCSRARRGLVLRRRGKFVRGPGTGELLRRLRDSGPAAAGAGAFDEPGKRSADGPAVKPHSSSRECARQLPMISPE